MQAAKMSFLHKVAACTLRDRMRSLISLEELRVEPLLLNIMGNQLRWLQHLFQMAPGRLPVFRACPIEGDLEKVSGNVGGTVSSQMSSHHYLIPLPAEQQQNNNLELKRRHGKERTGQPT